MDKMMCVVGKLSLKNRFLVYRGLTWFFLKIILCSEVGSCLVRGDDFTKFTETMQKGVSFKVF